MNTIVSLMGGALNPLNRSEVAMGRLLRRVDGQSCFRTASVEPGRSLTIARMATVGDNPPFFHPADPDRIVACSHYGELFASENAGDTWAKLPREFSEIRAVTWVPN